MKLQGFICAAVLVLSPAAFSAENDAASVHALLEKAQQQYAEAQRLEHAWSVTEPLMEEARRALQKGDLAAAKATAERALLTAEKSVEQARREREAWRERAGED